jgi:hypothetical protein
MNGQNLFNALGHWFLPMTKPTENFSDAKTTHRLGNNILRGVSAGSTPVKDIPQRNGESRRLKKYAGHPAQSVKPDKPKRKCDVR